MKISFIKKAASIALLALGTLSIGLPAHASTLINGWNYANDDQLYDGSGGLSGNDNFGPKSRYDFYGIGFKQVGNELLVGINTSYSTTGSNVISGVGYGDLLLDFGYDGGSTFKNAQGALVGIKFATNDSGVSAKGVYTGVTGKSVAGTNSGYTSLKSYNDKVKADNDNKNLANPNSRFGDLLWSDPYFADYTGGVSIPNVIKTGTLVNQSVRTLTTAELAAQLFPTTVNLPSNNKKVYGFAFQLPSNLKGKSFLATLGFECSNDTVSAYVPRAVPVPPAIAGLGVAGLFGAWRTRRQTKAKVA
ncbi:MAG: XDD3 domain-containing surface protein [Pseudanabaenaceae cyanobacterium bins.39]|nr:XDD3 domain-containing surface protein [Pseudanabaenaceae cyanobacterium bins.39]